MNKKLIILPLVSFGLLISCNNGSSSDSNSSTSNEMTSISESSSIIVNDSSDEISSSLSSDVDSITNGTSSFESSSEVSSIKLSVKEQLLQYLDDCVNNNNYTIVNDESSSYYVSNAYYTEDAYDEPHGYAIDSKGVFSYTISNEIVESIFYIKDADDLYSYSYGNYSWFDKTQYLFNSFANISLENLELTRVKNSKVESYTVPFDTFSSLLIENHLQSFLTAKYIGNGETEKVLSGTCTLSLISGGFNVCFKNPTTFTTLNYIVSNVGSTEIPVIENYIASGGVQAENFYTRVVSLFTSSNYKVTFSDGVIRYVTTDYIVEINGGDVSGYFISPDDGLIYEFNIVDDKVVVKEENPELYSLSKYKVNSSFLHGFKLKDEKLILDSYVTLSYFSSYFTAGEVENDNYIGYAEITGDLAFTSDEKLNPENCNITFNGREYDKNEGVLLDNYYSANYSDFGSTSFEIVENYLKTI